MMKRRLLALALILPLCACATIYSKQRDWRLPAGLGNYVLSARMDVGFLTRRITISVNGRDVLTGEAYWWSDRIAMSSQIDNLPIDAVCSQSGKTCDVNLLGIHAATLTF